jgi:hypothetical protein
MAVATEEELEALRKVAVSGVQSVEADGRKVVYRSQADIDRVIDGQGEGATKRRRKVEFTRGYK